ncbi:VOC family protein [Winogradskyella echinorum]|uniref:VOC family protein n=1 Tax=Winogradskyella echinorum TaxID=538189 RepID=A0ABR6Y1E1_9FLAO|nr:VOC family protein [Winogradskyella echinorum]MBC3846095.1 VOC family protein [Winogradskyella echinorum]MBC5750443.1 VOC family protein [Winogradskyella echinorum]
MAFNALIPTLEVENMDETIAFYETNLDFVCVNRDDNHWALMTKDDVDIMLSSRFNKDEFPKTTFTGSLYIHTDDVDVLWQILKDKVSICYPLESFEYGMREFAIYDNNGYRIQFGQELETN